MAIGVTSALVFAACSSAVESTNPTSTQSSTSTTVGAATNVETSSPTTTEPSGRWTSAQQEVLGDFLAARQAFSTSLEDPDPTDPSLPATHVDPMLTEVQNINAQWLGFGQAGRFPDDSVARTDPLSIEVNGDTATVETCGIDDSIVYEPATGRALNDDVVSVQATSTLVRVDDTWKLETRTEIQRWEGVAGCALDFS